MEKDLRNSILKAVDELTDSEQTTLALCSVLCTSEEGVSLRDLCSVIGTDPHLFRKEIESIRYNGLLAEHYNYVCCPKEVSEIVSKTVSLSAYIINPLIKRLCDKTALSLMDDLLQAKPFFEMAAAVMNYVIQNPDGIDDEVYGHLLVNNTRFFAVYDQPDLSITNNQDLPIIKEIKRVKSQIENNSVLFGLLCASEGFLLQAGFWYEGSKRLIEQSIAIVSTKYDNVDAFSYSNMMYALWYENHGQIGKSLALAYHSWQTAQDENQKCFTAIFIAYQLALLEEFHESQNWIDRIPLEKIPKFHPVKVFYFLILAMKYSNNATLSEEHLRHAEWVLDRINVNAALKSRVYYVKYCIYSKWGLKRESCEFYRLYSYTVADHYKSTDGAMYIYTAAVVDSLTSIGGLTAAKYIVQHKLDSMQLTNPFYAISVRSDVCLAYTEYYRAINVPLASTYCNIGQEVAEESIPSEETLTVLEKVFGGQVPATITGEETRWFWEYQNLKNMITNRDISRTELKKQIERLKERFPNHQQELEVISASLLDSYPAIHAWHRAISMASPSERFATALQCARIATSQGLTWDGADFYSIAQSTEGYKNLNKLQKIDILIEVATNLENCGTRQEARLIWVQLEALARGTSKLEDVWQARGNCSFDHEQYAEALEYYDKCLEVVQPEEGLIDQRISSIYSFRASCYGALGNYQAAYDNAVKAKQYFVLNDFDAFSLEYNHGFFALSLKKYKEARDVLTRAKTLARTKEDKDAVDVIWYILAMKKEKREAYLKQILYNFDA